MAYANTPNVQVKLSASLGLERCSMARRTVVPLGGLIILQVATPIGPSQLICPLIFCRRCGPCSVCAWTVTCAYSFSSYD